MNEKILTHVLWLALEQDYLKMKKVMKFFGNASNAEKATLIDMKAALNNEIVAGKVLFNFKVIDFNKEEDYLNKHNIHLSVFGDEAFPFTLENSCAPPFLLYQKGEKLKKHETTIAVIGTRKASDLGLTRAFQAGRVLSEAGLVVVSGLAFGIDAATHRGAVATKKRAIAVLASGVDRITPMSNSALSESILINSGSIISEYPPGTPALKHRFLERNRIVAALSMATLVIEAPNRSGALFTANLAINDNRHVFVTPGDFSSNCAKGSNYLLRAGAEAITDFDQILDFYNIKNKSIELNIAQKKIMESLKKGSLSLENICETTSQDFSQTMEHILELEINNKIRKNLFNEYEIIK